MTRQGLLVLLFICFVQESIGQTLGFSLAEGKTKVQIPIEISNNLVIVPVVVNGALPLKFILDTGVRTAILTQKGFSDLLNLAYSRKLSISGPGGVKVIDAYITNNVSLELPGVISRGHAMLVLEEDYLELRNYLGTDVHGVLGYELFSRFIVKIDYEKKLLTLMYPERFRPRSRYHVLPIDVQDTKPYVTTPVILNDTTKVMAKLLVDSGASHGLMLEPDTDENITVPSHTVSSIIGRGLGGEITGKVGRVKALQLGPFVLDNAIANFPDPNSYFDSLKIGSTPRNGSIGGEVLSRFTVVFNFSKGQMFLKRNASLKKPFYYNLSGLTVKAKGARLNAFEITEVRDGSAADKAGISAGDEIIAINGISASLLNLNLMIGYFNFKPGKQINLLIERSGERLKRSFRLEDQI
ncbi:MAG TPA: aspartyl protease family protein [Chryseosolibacter sp.]|nr:aspartyl protease family protein [Chryseosolibacter sp.]